MDFCSCRNAKLQRAKQCRSCWEAEHPGRQQRICATCGIFFKPKKTPQTYCSLGCRPKGPPPSIYRGQENNKWVPAVTLVCKYCSCIFEKKPWQLNKKNGSTGEFCSIQCRGKYRKEFQSKEKSPRWVGGPQSYRGRNWKAVRLLVVEVQEGRCAHCDVFIGKSLPVHHKHPARAFQRPEDANTLNNLVGLCQSCHVRLEVGTREIPGVAQMSAAPYQKACRRCGHLFLTNSMNSMTCDSCWHNNCLWCGKTFRIESPSRRARNKHCSRKCYLAARLAK